MTSNHSSSDNRTAEQLQHDVDDDIQKLRDAQQSMTWEEKVADLKKRGIDPAELYDKRGDDD